MGWMQAAAEAARGNRGGRMKIDPRPLDRRDTMTNPWMSAWLSAANRTTGAARGQISAETSRARNRMMQDWQKAWIETWMAMWFPWLNQGETSRKRGK